jgi:hypothetical protein
MLNQSTMEQFSWNALVSNVVSKLTPLNAEAESSSSRTQEEGRGESNQAMPPAAETREDVGTDTQQPKICVGSNGKNCAPVTTEEVQADLENTQVVMSEILKERNRKLRDRVKEQNPHQAKCGDFTVSCNPEAFANKEESEKPVMERRDDALEFVFDLVEIALCGDRKTNNDEAVSKKPTQKEQMPDPVQLLREKSIFQTLNPVSNRSKSKSKRRSSSRSEKDKERKETDSKEVMPSIKEGKSKETTSTDASNEKTETTKSGASETKDESPTSEITEDDVKVAEPVVSKPVPSDEKQDPSNEEEPKKEEVKEAVPVVAVASTNTEEHRPSEQEQEVSLKKEETSKQVAEEAVPATVSEPQEKPSKEQDLKEDVLQSQLPVQEMKKDSGDFPPRVIHLTPSNDGPNKTRPINASYTPNLRKMRSKGDKKVSSAVAAYNKMVPTGNFGDSTRVVGQQPGRSTALAKPDKSPELKVIEFLASLLSMGKNMDTPRTPRGVILLASMVSFLFWPEDLPRKVTSAPAQDPEVPSLLSLVGDKKKPGRTTSSPIKRRPPRPQLSSRRMNAWKKKSLNL